MCYTFIIKKKKEVEGSDLGDGCSEFHEYTEGKNRLIPKSVLLCSQQVLKLRVCWVGRGRRVCGRCEVWGTQEEKWVETR